MSHRSRPAALSYRLGAGGRTCRNPAVKSDAFSLRLLTALAVAGLWLALGTTGWCAGAPLSQWVYPSATGNLIYKLDERGQRIADFSNVGYRSGLAPLPDVSKLIESNRWVFVSPISGDDTTNLQAVINQVSALSLNSNGFRGVVFLNAGEYQLSNTITIAAGGVVLKGISDSSPSGSRLRATDRRQYTLVSVDGSGARTTVSDGFLAASDTFVLTVTAVNDAPEFVEITSPADGATLTAGAAFALAAAAFDVDGNLARVDFFQGGSRLGTDTNAPYTATWASPIPGSYTLTALATDASGLSVTSPPIHVTVRLPTTTLVATGSVWKYFDQTTDLGTAWRAPEFDDSAWPSGPAELGFGDGDEATTVVSNRARITTCFRRSFVATNPADFANLTLNLLRDDGVAFYLNGTEVFRNNMPTGAVTAATRAATTASGADEARWFSTPLSVAALPPGTNVLAAEVHQILPDSSDLGFAAALNGLLAFPQAPTLHATLAGPADATWFTLHSATNLTPPVVWTPDPSTAVLTNNQWRVMVPIATNGSRFYRLQAAYS